MYNNNRLVFPSVLQVYLAGTVFVNGKRISVLIIFGKSLGAILVAVMVPGFIDNTRLFCSSRDDIYAYGHGNVTAFCQITGN